MITGDITKSILFDPILTGADKLLILSSYATPNMASWYMKQLQEKKTDAVDISIIVGMTPFDGISIPAHQGFVSLHNVYTSKSVRSFSCSYLSDNPPEHSNLYIWLKGEKPERAFVGSADFTQNAFISSRREIMEECSITRCEFEATQFFNEIPNGKHTLHFPFYQTNTASNCLIYANCKNKSVIKQEYPEHCPHYCSEFYFSFPKHLDVIGKNNSLFVFDKNIFLEQEVVDKYVESGIDRFAYTPL